MYYSECEKRFLKVSFNNIRDFVATRSRFNKNADMKASLRARTLRSCSSSTPRSTNVRMDHAGKSTRMFSDGSSETRRTVTVNWEDRGAPIRPPPWPC
jgi:hypothetical protein